MIENWLNDCFKIVANNMIELWLEFLKNDENEFSICLPYEWYDQATYCIKYVQKNEEIELIKCVSPIYGVNFSDSDDPDDIDEDELKKLLSSNSFAKNIIEKSSKITIPKDKFLSILKEKLR